MNLMLSNDDGVNADGLAVLSEVLSLDHDVVVVAPDRDHSGASSALTLSRPLKITKTPSGFYAVDGTPADAAHMGIQSGEFHTFERVVSGINSHENLGDDVLYSGTFAAAAEGRLLEQAPIAVSLVNRGNFLYATAAEVVKTVLASSWHLPDRCVLNINVPDLPFEDLKGYQVTRLGYRAKCDAPVRNVDPRGRVRYWINGAGPGEDAGPGTDFHAVANGYVSITPVSIDMTRHDAISTLKQVFES